MKYYLGIDLGGTNIVAGVVDQNYQIICKEKVKTACPRPAQEIVDDMVKCSPFQLFIKRDWKRLISSGLE